MSRIPAKFRPESPYRHQKLLIERMQQYVRWNFYNNVMQSFDRRVQADLRTHIPFADQSVAGIHKQLEEVLISTTAAGAGLGVISSSVPSLEQLKRLLPPVDINQYRVDPEEDFGLCFGLSMIQSVMHTLGKDEWWQQALDAIAAWDVSKPASLDGFVRFDMKAAVGFTLGELFDRVINYVAFNHGNRAVLDAAMPVDNAFAGVGYCQEMLLLPEKGFELVHQSVVQKAVASDAYSQHFELDELVAFLQHNQLSFSRDISLVHSDGHTCALYYNSESSEPWGFYDPNSGDGGWLLLDSAEALATHLVCQPAMGYSLSFSVMSTTPGEVRLVKPVLPADEMHKRFSGPLIAMLCKFEPHAIPNVLKAIEGSPEVLRSFAQNLHVKSGTASLTNLHMLCINGYCSSIFSMIRISDTSEHDAVRALAQALVTPSEHEGETQISLLAESHELLTQLFLLAENHDTADKSLVTALGVAMLPLINTHWDDLHVALQDKRCLKSFIPVLSHMDNNPLREVFFAKLNQPNKRLYPPSGCCPGLFSKPRLDDFSLLANIKRSSSTSVLTSLREAMRNTHPMHEAFEFFVRRYSELNSRLPKSQQSQQLLKQLAGGGGRDRIHALPEVMYFLQREKPHKREPAYSILRDMVVEGRIDPAMLSDLPGLDLGDAVPIGPGQLEVAVEYISASDLPFTV
ncbi:MAG: hypothetical protein P1U63_02030 [Coxiellaceae bacterium]|nr:hypothetical protein [Coxiellaceae bacterium]